MQVACATKRLNLGWMVVSLVLKEEPVFVQPVNVYLTFTVQAADFSDQILVRTPFAKAGNNSCHIPKETRRGLRPSLLKVWRDTSNAAFTRSSSICTPVGVEGSMAAVV